MSGSLSVSSRSALVCAIALACAFSLPGQAGEGDDPNTCDVVGEAPDVIVGDLDQSIRWGSVGDITAFSVGTWSCNVGTCELLWHSDTPDHPVIGQSMYRLRNGRFEQIGQSWLKHGFFALSLELCDSGCVGTDGTTLGVRCADPYTANLNGDQGGLGPKFEVDASTGQFPYPFTDSGLSGDSIYKRLQVHNADLNPIVNTDALYFVEGQYVTRDDAAAGNHTNNASHREAIVLSSDGEYDIRLIGTTVREQPAIAAWQAHDPEVLLDTIDVLRDGRFLVGSKTFQVAPDRWRYEYAVHNLNSHRSMRSLAIPVPAGATIDNVGFHDVDYHSGEPFDGTDWNHEILDGPGGRFLTWSTDTVEENPNANALRWGTLYNFRFEASVGPSPAPGTATMVFFRPGIGDDAPASVYVPGPCNADGLCDPDEDCDSCPEDCLGPPPQEYCCSDGVCDPGEDECSCSTDCGPCLIACDVPADCIDDLACNGVEDCVDGFCAAGAPLCGDELCDEESDSCFECLFSDSCDDSVFCNGVETCVDNACLEGADPCPGQICVEERLACVDCLDDTGCDDGAFCNGIERCADDECRAGFDPCLPAEVCDEESETCVGCRLTYCDDGAFCNGVETCSGDQCLPGAAPCPGQICDELHATCIETSALQPAPGEPIAGLSPELAARFEAGRTAFERMFAEADGLGPVYNGSACADCHSPAGTRTAAVTRFGQDDGGVFDPLTEQGGAVLQEQAIRPACLETMPGGSNVFVDRVPTALFGAGLVGALDDADLQAGATNPPAGVSGRVNLVPLLEELGTFRVGRYGWKSQQATVLSAVAEQAVDQLGITNRLIDTDHAPNGDATLLAECDAVADPEDTPDGLGVEFLDRVTDYVQLLAPPPQTPRASMQGELRFVLTGCANCHKTQFTTPAGSGLFDGRTVKPYSDFLLHDMGANGDPSGQGDALPGEVRTAPLWGLGNRDRLWHDGRFDDGDFELRVRAAIDAHAAPGSEANAAAQAFAALSPALQNQLLEFLASLGRLEFDSNGDGAVTSADAPGHLACYSGPGSFYTADSACAIHDIDADGDVDTYDYALFVAASGGGFGGAVPDGNRVPGAPLLLDRAGTDLFLSWSPSCLEDPDYAVYQGNIGDWDNPIARLCGTGGETSTALFSPSGSTYYLIVPVNGVTEGSYGVDGAGIERPAAGGPLACYPQWRTDTCD